MGTNSRHISRLYIQRLRTEWQRVPTNVILTLTLITPSLTPTTHRTTVFVGVGGWIFWAYIHTLQPPCLHWYPFMYVRIISLLTTWHLPCGKRPAHASAIRMYLVFGLCRIPVALVHRRMIAFIRGAYEWFH